MTKEQIRQQALDILYSRIPSPLESTVRETVILCIEDALIKAQPLVDELNYLLTYLGGACPDMSNARSSIAETLASYAGSAVTWQPIATAPKDGTTIEVSYDSEHTDTCLAMWSQRPVCMGGSTVYRKPGWAIAPEGDTDTNLPIDAPLYWRAYAGSAEGEKESSSLAPDVSETNFDLIIDKAKEFATEYYGSVKEGDFEGQFVFDRIVNGFVAGRYAAIREPEKRDPWISQELAVKILKIRDELVRGDKQEAYHILYSIADPKMEKFKPWDELEKIASQPPAATNQEGDKK